MEKESDTNIASLGDKEKESVEMQNVPTLTSPDKATTVELKNVQGGDESSIEVCPTSDAKDAAKDVTVMQNERELNAAGKCQEIISRDPTDTIREETAKDLQNVLINDAKTAEECATNITHEFANTNIQTDNEKQTVLDSCDATDTLNQSLDIIEELPSADKTGVVVIQSVVQLAPPNGDSSQVELENRVQPDCDVVIIPSETNVIELMDITHTETLDDSHEMQLVSVQTANEEPADTQRAGELAPHNITRKAPSNSLGLLTQYGSDSDEPDESSESETASVIAVPTTSNKNYRTHVVEIDSNSETDSNETISSATESEDESEYLAKIAKVINKRIEENDDDNSDDDDDDDVGKEAKQRGRRKPPRVRGEMLLDDLPPIQDLQISVPAEECIEFGRVHSIVDQLLLVSALPNSILLDLDTVLFLEQGKRVLGEVFDVLGQVADPMYCIRFNTNEQIHEKGIHVGDIVYVAPKTDYTQYVILSSLTRMRGSDASWENDIEPPPRYLDYSDDEEEREARQQLRKQRRPGNKENDNNNDDDDPDGNKTIDATKRSRIQTKTENAAETRTRRERSSCNDRRNNDTNQNYHKRQQRYDSYSHSNETHNYQPHHNNTGSWHSHYNQQYHQRPPTHHAYRSPYPGPYDYQRPMYHTPPPSRSQHFHPYRHRSPMPTVHEQFASPAGHTMPPPQMSPPPPMHSMMAQPSPMHAMPPSPQMAPPPIMHSMPHQHMAQPPPMHAMPTSSQMSPQHMKQSPSMHTIPPQQPSNYVPNPMAFKSAPLSQPTNSLEKCEEPAPPGAD